MVRRVTYAAIGSGSQNGAETRTRSAYCFKFQKCKFSMTSTVKLAPSANMGFGGCVWSVNCQLNGSLTISANTALRIHGIECLM
jgi:sulfite reductase beta subunit-like hemoprotein